ncbi:MAG: RNA polymerase sigma factor [Verrucomicrobiota bacterium]
MDRSPDWGATPGVERDAVRVPDSEDVPTSMEAGPSDAEIVAEVRTGRIDRFEELVRRHQPRIFAMARRHARLEREVEDIVMRSS